MTDHQLEHISQALVMSTDKLSSLAVSIREDGRDDAEGTHLNSVLDVLTTLWQLRWELGVHSGQVQTSSEVKERRDG